MTTVRKIKTRRVIQCPCCGKRPMILHGEMFEILCGNPLCKISISTYLHETLAEAVRAWNTRAPVAKLRR